MLALSHSIALPFDFPDFLARLPIDANDQLSRGMNQLEIQTTLVKNGRGMKPEAIAELAIALLSIEAPFFKPLENESHDLPRPGGDKEKISNR